MRALAACAGAAHLLHRAGHHHVVLSHLAPQLFHLLHELVLLLHPQQERPAVRRRVAYVLHPRVPVFPDVLDLAVPVVHVVEDFGRGVFVVESAPGVRQHEQRVDSQREALLADPLVQRQRVLRLPIIVIHQLLRRQLRLRLRRGDVVGVPAVLQ